MGIVASIGKLLQSAQSTLNQERGITIL